LNKNLNLDFVNIPVVVALNAFTFADLRRNICTLW